jgi:hypothetical protein
LLDRNELTGSVQKICSTSTKSILFAIADCDEVEWCTCCVLPCCDDQTDCHDYNMLANADPEWESGYDRQFFDFGDSTGTYWRAPVYWVPAADDDEFGDSTLWVPTRG